MDYAEFMEAVQRRLPANFGATPKVCVRAVFQTLHHRIGPGQAGHIETHLPQELKKDWDFPTPAGRSGEDFDRRQFLQRVQQLAGLESLDQAREATEVVFSVLRQAIPPEDVRDTADELPPPLRDLWLATNV